MTVRSRPTSAATRCCGRRSTTAGSWSTGTSAGSEPCCSSSAAGWARYSDAIGPEPSAADFTADRLGVALKGSRQAVKKVLMSQRHLAGVGNIYANEALFAAGIDPSKPAGTHAGRPPPAPRRDPSHPATAIASSGTTVRDYRTGTGEAGNFQHELLVYGREGEPCRRCGTRLTGTHEIDARISVFCHRCQS